MFFKLDKNPKEAKLNRYWRFFFLFFGINAAVGFVTHGFKSYFTEQAFYYVFMCMNLASVPITFSLMKANVENTAMEDKTKKSLNIVIFFASAVFIGVTVLTNTFVVVKLAALISIIFSIIVHVINYRKGYPGNGLIIWGFIVSVSALIVHGAKLSFSDWFNYKDISHVIMITSMLFIYVGVNKQLRSSLVRNA